MAVYRLLNRRVIAELGHPIKEGKESIIIHAAAPDGRELAVKVHTSKAFRGREKKQYVFGDWRFRHAKQHIVLRTEEIWAEKELRNLARLEKAGVPAPQPVGFEQNVVVMTFVGKKGIAAPQLIKVEAFSHRIAQEIVTAVRHLVTHAGLVHGDLSPYNILLWRGKPYLIDLSQAVLTSHPEAERLLRQDLEKVEAFFVKRGLDLSRLRHLEDELLAFVLTSRGV
jgi:RIO kinase 1